MMHSMGVGSGWIVVALVLWAVAVGAATWVTVRMIHRLPPRSVSLPSPLDILDRRYAAGAMTRDEFDDARARLREHELEL